MLYELEQSNNAMEAIKDIFCAKDKGSVDYNTVTRYFHLACKKLNNQARSGRPKTMDPNHRDKSGE